MATEDQIAYLLRQFLQDRASDQELIQLEQWLQQQNDQDAGSLLASLYEPESQQPAPDQARLNAILARIEALQPQPSPSRIISMRKWKWAAACILVLIAAGAWLWISSTDDRRKTDPPLLTAQKKIAPGKAGAILTLADGTQLVLDSLGNGAVTTQNGSQVSLENGHLSYDPTNASGIVAYNTMTTPRGRQFQLTLPDGTGVWLNAASSITYPVSFSGSNRKVTITGEAYLEVARNNQQPFLVDVDGKSQVEVLGTSFNINSYSDEESIRTTLIDGSIKVSKAGQSAILKPGQQADITPSSGSSINIINDTDLEKTLAWKNGLFNFNGATLPTVMRQLERWYNIKVRYESTIPTLVFKGEMYRDVNLSDVLEVLQRMGLKFKMEGNTLLVL